MFLFAVGIFAISILAQNETSGIDYYVECYNNTDYRNYHDKPYCYAGTCTVRCPPGYVQLNYGSEPTFVCNCSADAGFEVDGYFSSISSDPKIPKCKCSKSYCTVTVYAAGVGYTDGLIPQGSPPNCKIIPDEVPLVLTEFIFFFVIGTMIIFTFINCRSASGVIYDYHRYIALYVIASIAVIVFVQTVTPFTSGFTRSMGFGVIIHNSAEWNFILRLHYGKQASVRNNTNMCVMLYYVLLLVAMVILPLEVLLWVAMIQGGFLDWTLVFFICIGGKNMKDEENWQPICSSCCKTSYSRFSCWFGTAAVFHLLTVQVLFVGFALNNPVLIGLGSLLLVPTFLCYTYWAYGEDRLSLLCGPSLVTDYKVKQDDSMMLIPFAHTTRTPDVLWQGLLKNRWTFHGKVYDEASENAGNGSETVKLIEPNTDRIDIQDFESFKFGVDDNVSKCTWCGCSCCAPCCTWIPLYWIGAFVIVVLNATAIIVVPSMITGKGECITGFEYGAW